jgi:hypothetical protein
MDDINPIAQRLLDALLKLTICWQPVAKLAKRTGVDGGEALGAVHELIQLGWLEAHENGQLSVQVSSLGASHLGVKVYEYQRCQKRGGTLKYFDRRKWAPAEKKEKSLSAAEIYSSANVESALERPAPDNSPQPTHIYGWSGPNPWYELSRDQIKPWAGRVCPTCGSVTPEPDSICLKCVSWRTRPGTKRRREADGNAQCNGV